MTSLYDQFIDRAKAGFTENIGLPGGNIAASQAPTPAPAAPAPVAPVVAPAPTPTTPTNVAPVPTPTPTPEPTPTGGSTSRTIYTDDNEKETVKTTEQIQREMIRAAQGEINSVNEYAKSLLAEQKVINEKNDRSTSSISSLTGLGGSTDANIAQQKTTAVGQAANTKIKNEAEMKVRTILGNIRTAAIAESRAQREDARLDETTRIANRAARQAEAVNNLQNLTASGVTFEGLKTGDPEGFKYMSKTFGGEDMLKGAMILNTPQDQILDKKIVGSNYVISRQNPLTGKVTVDTMKIEGLPPDYSSTVDLGDRIMFFDPTDPQNSQFFVSKGMTPAQRSAAGSGGGGGETTLAEFPPDIQAAAQSILDGKSKLNEYPSAKRLTINAALSKIYTAEGGNELAQGAYDAANILKDHKGLSAAVGTNAMLGFGKTIPGSASAGFLSQLDTLKANLKLVNIKYLKGTGALSDAEGKTLEDASTSLNPSLPEEDFKAELKRVTNILEKAKGVKPVAGTEVSEEQQLLDAGYTQEQINALKAQ